MRAEHGQFAADPHTRAIYTRDGEPIAAGALLRNRNLGTTLRRIAQDGRKTFYEGEIAKAIVEFSRARDGLLTEEDLGNFHAHWAEPIQVNYRGYEVYEMPPNSSGHILLQELNIVELFDLQNMGLQYRRECPSDGRGQKARFRRPREVHGRPGVGRHSARWHVIEIVCCAAGRTHRPEAGGVRCPIRRAGSARGYHLFLYGGPGGNLVCILQSIQSGFGSNLIAGETGILLNNRMTYWHLEEGHPNCLMPGKRVRHTMNPVIVTKDGRPVLTCGTPGADTQVQTNLQLVTHLLDFGMTPQEAVAAPRWRSLQNPMESTIPHVCSNNLQLEDRFPASVQDDLARRGHELELVGDWGGPGSAQAIMVHPESGALIGGSDPRRDGYAIGY